MGTNEELRIWSIWSNEHNQYWRANCMGYTSDISEAGLYTRSDALEICRKASVGKTPKQIPNEIIVPSWQLLYNLESMVSDMFENVKYFSKFAELAKRSKTFFDDVLPQIGGLCIQDLGNVNELGILLDWSQVEIKKALEKGEENGK